jgi:hypothetical protein
VTTTTIVNLRFGLSLVFLAAGSLGLLAADDSDAVGVEFYEKKIRPVLVKQCYSCHSAKAKEIGGKLRLDTRAAILKGGESGPVVVPKNLDASLLIESIRYESLEMPPKKKLSEHVIADFEQWVKMGVPIPKTAEADPASINASANAGGDVLWSLQPIERPQPPDVKQPDWPRNEIDRFLLHRLEQGQLTPVADARPFALLRRIHFDLVGLPPAPQEVDAFARDSSPAAFAKVVDRLLASPQFGERWGRHWLDVARYAESNGKSRDVLMPHAWRYRDYVIDAFNADLPYNRFITEQIAGDLLTADSNSQRDQQRVATGFLAVGSKPLSGGNLQMDIVDEQIDVVGKAVIGLTISCARCHDHKFDPIPTADYYAMAGIFRSTETLYGGGLRRGKGRAGQANTLLILGEDADKKLAQYRTQENSRGRLGKQRKALNKKIARLKSQLPKDWKVRLQKFRAAKTIPNEDGNSAKQDDKQPQSQADQRISRFAATQDELRAIDQKLKTLNAEKIPELEFAVGVRDARKVADCKIHIRGERSKLGDVAPRGFLSSIVFEDAPQVNAKQSGRLELAQWLTNPQHPLTARVAVNRIWLHLFGRGIVATVDNFGMNGRKPSHPELLDFLARSFIDNGWSTKKLVREIVLSHTYQLSTDFHRANDTADPENAFFWRMSRRRLEAEALRDAMLAASGRLQKERPHASAVARIGNGEVGRGIKTAPLYEDFPHRSVYLPIIRGIVPEMLKIFDFPEPSNPQSRRDVTNVPSQSLFLMNSPFVIEHSAAMAKRVIAAATENEARLELAYKLCFGRLPTESEKMRGLAFLRQCDVRLAADQLNDKQRDIACWATYCQALFASAEFRFLE